QGEQSTAYSAQAATPVTGESLTTAAELNGVYRTAKLGPITDVVVDNATDTEELVLGTDYEILNADVGLIRILPTATKVTTGESLTIDYTPTAYADGVITVKGGTKTNIEGSVLYVSDNTTGPQMMVEVWNVSVKPDGAMGLISEEFASMTLSMSVLEDN